MSRLCDERVRVDEALYWIVQAQFTSAVLLYGLFEEWAYVPGSVSISKVVIKLLGLWLGCSLVLILILMGPRIKNDRW